MKRKVVFFILLFFVMITPVIVDAEEKQGVVTADANLRVRSGPGQSYDKIGVLSYNEKVTIIETDKTGDGCENAWVKIKYGNNNVGYSCSTYIKEIEQVTTGNSNNNIISIDGQRMAQMSDIEFDAYLNSQGFPESYKVKLRELHKIHPTWIFIGTKTNYSWASAVVEQDEFVSYNKDASPGRSFLNINPSRKEAGMEGYLSTQPADYNYYTNTFVAHDGTYWFQANTKAVAHFMDPRNYLTEKAIFMFEDLTYDSSYQTEDAVKLVLYSSFLKQFSSYFIKAAQNYNVSPIYLASLVRQEVGTGTSNICTNGKAGVLSNGVNYTGYYNFFNIGASSSSDPKLMSLKKAKEYNWNTQEKAIVEGSYIISKNYIQCGQHTLYYQKYNFSPKATKGLWHQYTTNINSLESQANTTFNSYKNMGLTETSFKFDIPIFSDMPESTPLPALGNPNNYMKEIKVNNLAITNFDGAIEKHSITIPYSESIIISGSTVATTSKVSGLGTFAMTNDTQVQKIVVTSQNGISKTYEITINRQPNLTPSKLNTNTNTNENTNNENNNSTNNNTNTNTNNIDINNIINTSTYNTDGQYMWNVTFGSSVSTLIDNIKKQDSSLSITIKDSNNNNKNSGSLYTGDKVIVSTGSTEKVYQIVIYGDTNGDGNVSAIDLLNVQKIILNKSNLTGANYKAADTNRDGKISAIDLLNVQKHILGKLIISQS